MAIEAILAALEAASDAAKKQAAAAGAGAPAPLPPRRPAPRLTQPVARRPEPAPEAPRAARAEAMPAFDAIEALDALPMHVIDLEHEGPRPTGLLSGLFESGKGLLRAVVAAEVLAPPLTLREQSNWSPPPNAPST